MRVRWEQRGELWIATGLAALAVFACLPVLLSGFRLGYWDWDIFQASFEVARKSVVEYGQLPGWNPYARGGVNLLSHPLLPLASPSFLVILVAGTIPGIKIWIVVRQFVALFGAYLLGRRLAFGRLGALTVAIVFGLSSCYAQRVAHGHWNLQAFVFLPLVIQSGLGAIQPGAWRARGFAALWLALAFLDGGPYSLAIAGLGLAAVGIVAVARGRSRLGLPVLAGVALLGFALAAAKGVPVWDAYKGGEREFGYGSHFALDFYSPDFVPSSGESLYTAMLDRQQASRPGRFETFHVNVGAYVGPIGLALAVLGLAIGGASARVSWLLGVPILWLCLGASAPLNLWELVHRLPIASSMSVPSKFTACYLLALAVAAGAAVDALANRAAPGIARVALAALVVGLGTDLLLVSRPLMAQAFPIEPPTVQEAPFHQVVISPYWPWYQEHLLGDLATRPIPPPGTRALQRTGLAVYTASANFPAVRANVGVLRTTDGGGNVEKVGARADPDRLGVHQIGIDGVPRKVEFTWSPNELRAGVDPALEGWLVVNQNHHPGWRANSSAGDLAVTARDGRLGVELPMGIDEVTLHFEWAPWRMGVWISAFALVVTVAMMAADPRHRSQ